MGLGKYKPGQRELTGVGIDTPGGGSEYYLFGGNVTAAIKAAHQLRYRMLPFIYSTFATEVAAGEQSIFIRMWSLPYKAHKGSHHARSLMLSHATCTVEQF